MGSGLARGMGRGGLLHIFSRLIRCFSSEVGHGFIACPELKGLGYQNDVYVHHLQIGTFGQGDEVSFDAYLNAKGQPRSKDLASAEGQLADFKKQLEEELLELLDGEGDVLTF